MQLPVMPATSESPAKLEASELLDPTAKFSCSSCGACCDQPWATVISEADAARYDAVDWAAENPQLKDRLLYKRRQLGQKEVLELTKLRGNRCIFLLDDNRCAVHAKLGVRAKPQMCQTFPYLPVVRGGERRVSVNFGCGAVLKDHGLALRDQRDEIQACLSVLKPRAALAEVALDATQTLPSQRADDLLHKLEHIFEPSAATPLVARFEQALSVMEGLTERPAQSESTQTPRQSAAVPLGCRMLLAANLYPDICDPARKTWLRGFGLIPKLTSVTQLRGGYASRLLGRLMHVGSIFEGPASCSLAPEAEALLVRYFHARLWQRHALKSHGNIVASLHQHVIDFASVVFFAHAYAGVERANAGLTLNLPSVQSGLRTVEFHIANQERLTSKVLQGWFAAVLADLGMARASLKLVRLRSEA